MPRVGYSTAVITLIIVRISLLLFSFKSVYHFFANNDWAFKYQGGSEHNAVRLAKLVDTAANSLPIELSCLTRACACQMLLRLNGFTSELKMGVSSDGNKRIKAHAWIEMNHQILIGNIPEIDSYQSFPLLESKVS